jgi:4-amino-4-deoxy-L-arabinose transferase-like glycosyltransferase
MSTEPHCVKKFMIQDIQSREQTDPDLAKDQADFASIFPLVTSVLLALIVVTGAILRFHSLTDRNFWDDEAASVIFAELPWSSFWRTVSHYEANMSFYYLLLRGWVHFGDSEVVIRSLSVLFGLAAIPATYLLGRRLFGAREGLVSAALSAVNMFQIRYSQEARGYSLLLLLSILSTYFFLRAMDSPREKRYWFGYVVMGALGVYTHIFFYLVVLAQWLPLGYARLRSLRFRTVLWTAAGFIVLTAPMTLFLLTKDKGQVNWVPRPTVQLLLDFAKLFTGYGGSGLLAAYGALCLIAAYVAYRGTKHEAGSSGERWRVNLVISWLAFPIASTVLVSFLRPIFYDRFMAISAPALALLAGKGMFNLNRLFPRLRFLFPASLVLVTGMSMWGIHRYDDNPASQGDSWRLATHYVLAGQQAGDAAFFYRASGSRPFTYYAHREIEEHGATSSPVVIFPSDVSNAQEFNVEPNDQQTRLALGGRKRIWLILQHYESLSERQAARRSIQNVLQKTYHVSQDQMFPGASGPIHVSLYVRDSSSAPAPIEK